jgi:hypothetical protein
MHEIDLMLQLQLEGKHKEGRVLSDKLERIGKDKIQDPWGKNTVDIWMRHCFNRGWFKIQEGDYQNGCQLLENGRFLSVYGSPPLYTKAPIFNPAQHNIKGKTIIISLEGGYGDEIIHARFAPSYKKLGAAKVYIAAAPELVSVFSRIKDVDGVILRNEADKVKPDFWVPGFSAGWVAGHTFDNFPSQPFLSALPNLVDKWKSRIKPNKKPSIGIRWAGNPKFEHQQFRRFPYDFMLNLKEYADDLNIFSLQKDHNTLDVPKGVIDLQEELTSWEETAAVIENLDLVITSCTAIAHLAGSMGKETWVIVPILPYHTWTWKAPESTTTPYYDSVRIFRQKDYNKWNKTFQPMYSELEKKFDLTHKNLPDEDKIYRKLNLGCGFKKFKGFHNVDISPIVKPDEVVNLEKTPWPWKEGEFCHITAKDILEHLGNSSREFMDIIKEMYRISSNGAIWEIQVPHWRCDIALNDPFHKRLITVDFFKMLDQKRLMDEKIVKGESDSLLAYEEKIDIEVCDVKFLYTGPFEQRMKNKTITEEELNYALNHLNNVAVSTILLLQVHKPCRYNDKEFETAITKIVESNNLLESNSIKVNKFA